MHTADGHVLRDKHAVIHADPSVLSKFGEPIQKEMNLSMWLLPYSPDVADSPPLYWLRAFFRIPAAKLQSFSYALEFL